MRFATRVGCSGQGRRATWSHRAELYPEYGFILFGNTRGRSPCVPT